MFIKRKKNLMKNLIDLKNSRITRELSHSAVVQYYFEKTVFGTSEINE